MPTLLDYTIHQAVEKDSLPRVGEYDDGSRHVLYLDGAIVRSKTLAEWGDAPKAPTPAESAAAVAARETERGTRQANALLRRQRVHDLAASAVGVKIGALTPRQVEALLGVLLERAGALDDNGAVRPVEAWAG